MLRPSGHSRLFKLFHKSRIPLLLFHPFQPLYEFFFHRQCFFAGFCFVFWGRWLMEKKKNKKQSPLSSVKLKIPNFSFGAQRYHWVSACICLLHSFSLDPLCVFGNWLGALQRSPPPPVVCFICDDHTSLTTHWDVKSCYSEAGWSIEVGFGKEDSPTPTALSFPPQCQNLPKTLQILGAWQAGSSNSKCWHNEVGFAFLWGRQLSVQALYLVSQRPSLSWEVEPALVTD